MPEFDETLERQRARIRIEEEEKYRKEQEEKRKSAEEKQKAEKKKKEEEARKAAEDREKKEKEEDEKRKEEERKKAEELMKKYIAWDNESRRIAKKLGKERKQVEELTTAKEKVEAKCIKLTSDLEKVGKDLESADSNFLKRGFGWRKRLEKKQTQLEQDLGNVNAKLDEIKKDLAVAEADVNKHTDRLKEIDLEKREGKEGEEGEKILRENEALILEYGFADKRQIEEYEDEAKEAQEDADALQEKIVTLNEEIEKAGDKLDSKWEHYKSFFKIASGKEERQTHRTVKAKRAEIKRLEKEKKKAEKKKARANLSSKIAGGTAKDVLDPKIEKGREISKLLPDDDPVLLNAKGKAEEAAKNALAEHHVELAAKKGKLSKTKYGKELIEKAGKDAAQINKAMDNIMKGYPNGVPLPGDTRFVIEHNKKLKFRDEDEEAKWYDERTKKFLKNIELEYKPILISLDNIFGDNGYMNRLAKSPYTDQAPGRPGFVNLTQEVMEAWNKLNLEKEIKIFNKSVSVLREGLQNTVDSGKSSVFEIDDKDVAPIRNIGNSIAGDTTKALQACKLVLGSNYGSSFSKKAKGVIDGYLQEIDEYGEKIKKAKEDINVSMEKFKKEYEDATTCFDGFMKKCDTLMAVVEAVVVMIPKVGTQVSLAIGKTKMALSKIAAHFDLKENKSSLMKEIQSGLAVQHEQLNKSFNKSIRAYRAISNELIASKVRVREDRNGAVNDKVRKEYDACINDWRKFLNDIMEFNIKCKNLGKSYKQRNIIHLTKGKRDTQAAKWKIAKFLENGVFDLGNTNLLTQGG